MSTPLQPGGPGYDYSKEGEKWVPTSFTAADLAKAKERLGKGIKRPVSPAAGKSNTPAGPAQATGKTTTGQSVTASGPTAASPAAGAAAAAASAAQPVVQNQPAPTPAPVAKSPTRAPSPGPAAGAVVLRDSPAASVAKTVFSPAPASSQAPQAKPDSLAAERRGPPSTPLAASSPLPQPTAEPPMPRSSVSSAAKPARTVEPEESKFTGHPAMEMPTNATRAAPTPTPAHVSAGPRLSAEEAQREQLISEIDGFLRAGDNDQALDAIYKGAISIIPDDNQRVEVLDKKADFLGKLRDKLFIIQNNLKTLYGNEKRLDHVATERVNRFGHIADELNFRYKIQLEGHFEGYVNKYRTGDPVFLNPLTPEQRALERPNPREVNWKPDEKAESQAFRTRFYERLDEFSANLKAGLGALYDKMDNSTYFRAMEATKKHLDRLIP